MPSNPSRLAIRNNPIIITDIMNTDSMNTPRSNIITSSPNCTNRRPNTPNNNNNNNNNNIRHTRGYKTPQQQTRTPPGTPYQLQAPQYISNICKSPGVYSATDSIDSCRRNNYFDSMTETDGEDHSDVMNSSRISQGSFVAVSNYYNDRFIGSRPSIGGISGKDSGKRSTPPFKNITQYTPFKEDNGDNNIRVVEDEEEEEEHHLFSDSILTDPSICNPLLFDVIRGSNGTSRTAVGNSPSDYIRSYRANNTVLNGTSPSVGIDDPSSPLRTSGRRILNPTAAVQESQGGNINNNNNNNPHNISIGTVHNEVRGVGAGGSPSQANSAAYTRALVESLSLGNKGYSQSVLGLHSPNKPIQHQSASEQFKSSQGVVYQENKIRNFQSHSFRVIPQTPDRILDAPELLDDFYLNLLDWSSRNNLAVALGNTCYLWNADTGSITQLMSSQEADNIVTAVAWHSDGKILAIGLQSGEIQLWDSDLQKSRNIRCHNARVCSLSWNGSVLASGSRDTTIRLHDLRNEQISILMQGHTQEVCGLRWSPNGQQLASGGNDNILNIWEVKRSSLNITLQWQFSDHSAAIKAIAWNPVEPHILVSGGGTACKTLRFWDTAIGESLHVVNTDSQVCGVMWNHEGNELVSSHGYSDNQLTIWKYPSMKKMANLKGHTSRVLHLAMSPDGQVVVSAAGDETIRFWRCFGSVGENQVNNAVPSLGDASLPSLGQQQSAGELRRQRRRRRDSGRSVYGFYSDSVDIGGGGGTISASLIGKKLPFSSFSVHLSKRYDNYNSTKMKSMENGGGYNSDYDSAGPKFNKDDWLLQTDLR